MSNLNHGLSGCKIEIINDKILRKYSSSKEYNSRLLLQYDKQLFFSNFILKNIDTPRIHTFKKDKLYYFDMEYICGESFYDYFLTTSVHDIEFVIQTLFGYFDFLITTQRPYKINSNIINKINSLKSKTEYKNYLQFIEDYTLRNNIFVPKTFCHGDLTFTNILFHKNRLFFIDFLDSYVDSFICDLIKIKQDLYYLWTIKVQDLYSMRIVQIYYYIWNRLLTRYQSFIQNKTFDILDALNLLRIEPYLTNQKQYDILKQIIESSTLYEEFNRTYGRKIF